MHMHGPGRVNGLYTDFKRVERYALLGIAIIPSEKSPILSNGIFDNGNILAIQ